MNRTNKDYLPPDLHPNIITIIPAPLYPCFPPIYTKLYGREAEHAVPV